jgi:hypothetical protein
MKGNDLRMRAISHLYGHPQNFWREPQLKQFLAELSQQLAKEIKKPKDLEE